jgi:hypothetical protein
MGLIMEHKTAVRYSRGIKSLLEKLPVLGRAGMA